MKTTPALIAVAAALSLALVCTANVFPVTVTDDRGREIRIASRPERIVAVGALYAQILVDLGGIDRLVAVGETSDNPPEVLALPSAGPTYAPNVELILALEPDLVLGATDWGGERPMLEAAGVTVLTTPYLTSVAAIFETIRTIGSAIGAVEQSDAEIGRIATQIVQAEALAIGKPAVTAAFLYASSTDDPPHVAGSDAIEHELILRAGGVNVFSELPWTSQVSFEEIIARDPQVIFVAPSQIENITRQPLLQGVSAVINDRVVGIRASLVASTRIAEALRAMIEGLHGVSP